MAAGDASAAHEGGHATWAERLTSIIEDTTDEVFEVAGGYEFTDEIAVKLAERWRKHQGPVVPVAVIDLAWLLDGYARARGATTPAASQESGQ